MSKISSKFEKFLGFVSIKETNTITKQKENEIKSVKLKIFTHKHIVFLRLFI